MFLAVHAVLTVILHHLVPRFFWLDDSQAQFGSTAWWLGRNLSGGVPPLADPDLGVAGNFASDMQYGALDPLHWLAMAVLSRSDNVLTMAWLYGAFFMGLLGLGVVALLRRYDVRTGWAVAVAVGVSTSGFFLWYGSVWWPLMWASAWLPWLWLGLSGRSPWSVFLTGLATWGVLASGNPYTLPFALVVVLAQTLEYLREHGGVRGLVQAPRFWVQATACTGGAVVAFPTLLNALEVSEYQQRQLPEAIIGNGGNTVPNLLDVLVGGVTLLGQTNAFNGPVGLVPAMGTALVAVPALSLIRWSTAIRSRGVLTAVALTVTAVAATQLPTVVGLFRFPFRYLVVVQIALPLLTVLGLTVARAFSRPRLVLALGLALLQFAVAVSRAPVLWRWHALALVLTLAALTALVFSERAAGAGARRATAILLVAAQACAPVLGIGAMITVQDRRIEAGLPAGAAGRPYRDIGVPGQSGADAMGVKIKEFRDRSLATDEHVTVYAWGPFDDVFGADRGWSTGFFPGNANLLADARVGTGYVASAHAYLGPILCTSYVGSVGCGDTSRILAEVPGVGRPWLDVLSSDRVVLSVGAPPDVVSWFQENWDAGEQDSTWLRFSRPADQRHPGRVASLDGVTVAEHGWVAGLARIGSPQESYTVTTAQEASGTVLLRVPYWPGYRATVNGEPVQVTSLAGALVQVEVPAGVDSGHLEIWYDPVGARILVPVLAAGLGLIVLSVVVTAFVTRRSRCEQPSARRSG